MFKTLPLALLAGACFLASINQAAAIDAGGYSQPGVIYAAPPAAGEAPMRTASADGARMGGGFIEFVFGDRPPQAYPHGAYPQPPVYQQQPGYEPRRDMLPPMEQQQAMPEQDEAQGQPYDPRQRPFDPKYEKQMVGYDGKEHAGTIVIDTPNKFLYLVQGDGRALRYGIGVGKPGFTWSGVKTVSAKREWPDWTPPAEMIARRPDLPRHMAGGPENPLGARAMYLGSTLYRIHGSNEPWTIGTNVSSGCIRMRNDDVIDLYGRVTVGARVIVM